MIIEKSKPTRPQDKNTKSSVSSQAGLLMPTARIKKMLALYSGLKRLSKSGVIYMTAALEYITGELLEVSTIKATEAKKSTISNRHVYLGAKADKELFNVVLGNMGYIREAGFTTDNAVPSVKKSKNQTQTQEKSQNAQKQG